MKKLLDYTKIAQLFVFPTTGFADKVNDIQHYLNSELPEAGKTLQPFTDVMNNVSVIEMEDLYLRSFEVQAITTLDIGYVAFGDDYKRGELLVNLNNEHRTYGIDCGNELADNLYNVMRLIAVLQDEVLQNDLVNKLIVPTLDKMIAGFGKDRLDAREKVYKKHHKTLLDKHESFLVYKNALKTLLQVLHNDFDIKIHQEPERSAGFLGSIKQEITIES